MVAKSHFSLRMGLACVGVFTTLSGCAGSGQHLGVSTTPSADQSESSPPVDAAEPTDGAEPEAASSADAQGSPSAESKASEPEFKPGMSVIEAVNAVPQGAERVEIEHDVLIEPLMNTELYAPCKLRQNQHFAVKVAVWDGRVVGLDVDATPKSQEVEQCLRSRIESLSWKKKVKSLSTVEFNY
jgi:hypothetical protein